MDLIRDHWRINIEGCVSFQITQKLKLLKSKLKLLYGKEHLQMEVNHAHCELLHYQNLLHDNPGGPEFSIAREEGYSFVSSASAQVDFYSSAKS